MSKLFITIFSILSLIVFAELTYILINGRINPTPTPTVIEEKTNLNLTPTPFPNHAVNLDGLSMLTYWQRGVVNSAQITVGLKGTIVKIDTNGKVQEHNWTVSNYALKIKIQGEDNESNDVFLSQADLQKTVFKKQNSNNTTDTIDYKDLKLNDKIQVTLVLDLTKALDNNFVSAQVVKLQ